MTNYKNVTYLVEEPIIKEIKQMALDYDTTQKELVNTMLKDGIKRKRGQTKLDE